MAKFVVAKDVEQKVLPMVVPPTLHIARQVETAAKRNAPPLKNWVSMHDNRVRPQHVKADLDGPIPENLRFKLESTEWDRQHRYVGEFSYVKEPPHEGDSRAYTLMVHCRCHAVRDPDGVAKTIHVEAPILGQNRVTVNVVSEGDWVVQSEFGTVYPGDLIAAGSFYMRRAAVEVAGRRRTVEIQIDAGRALIGSF